MSEKKKNIPLIIALSIPVLMVMLITISIYLPILFVKPQFNFVYSTGVVHCYNNKYSVHNEKIIENEIKIPNDNNSCRNYRDPRLFYYDVQQDTSREITFAEAQKLTLDNRYKSPDGFEIVSGNRSLDIFFFGGSSYYDKYLKKKVFSRKLKIGRRTYYHNFKFIGWIKE